MSFIKFARFINQQLKGKNSVGPIVIEIDRNDLSNLQGLIEGCWSSFNIKATDDREVVIKLRK